MPREKFNSLHAEDLKVLMDRLGISRAHLVGLSLGGTVALDMLALHPERLLSVTAASGDVFDFYPAPNEPWTANAVATRRATIAASRAEGLQVFKRRWLDNVTARGGGCVESIRPKLWDQIAKWTAWQPLHFEPRLLLGRSLIDRLKARTWTLPVQLLTGDADAAEQNKFAIAFPNVHQVIIPNAGHMVNMENPLGFNQAVLRFIFKKKTSKVGIVTPCNKVG